MATRSPPPVLGMAGAENSARTERLSLKTELRSRLGEGGLHERMRAINDSISERTTETDPAVVYTAPTVPHRIIRDVPDERLEALKYEMLTQIENGLRRERTHHERALQLQAESDALRAENAALRDGLDALCELTLFPPCTRPIKDLMRARFICRQLKFTALSFDHGRGDLESSEEIGRLRRELSVAQTQLQLLRAQVAPPVCTCVLSNALLGAHTRPPLPHGDRLGRTYSVLCSPQAPRRSLGWWWRIMATAMT